HFKLGESLIGQAALEKQRILLVDVPTGYMKVSSGLGESRPTNIVVLPILFEGKVKAVMELSSLERFNATHQAFLDQLAESIGIVLHTIEANTRTENLLEQSQSLAAELQKTNQELQEKARSNLAKDQFLAMLSHELRTPLTPVLASAVALENEPDLSENVHESLQMIRRNVELEARLIDDLLDLTRIDKGKIQLSFEAFEQGGRTQLGGLGLGLAISKRLVEAHSGTITAESAGRNKGAKFTLIFPVCEKVDAQAPLAVSPRAAHHRAMRVLLVEDHEDTKQSLTKLLRLRGYYVESASNVQSALDLIAQDQFDVLISY